MSSAIHAIYNNYVNTQNINSHSHILIITPKHLKQFYIIFELVLFNQQMYYRWHNIPMIPPQNNGERLHCSISVRSMSPTGLPCWLGTVGVKRLSDRCVSTNRPITSAKLSSETWLLYLSWPRIETFQWRTYPKEGMLISTSTQSMTNLNLCI